MREVDVIRGSRSRLLEGLAALGVTGSAAVCRAVDVARELIRHGADVRVFESRAAARLVSPRLFEWATGREVVVDVSWGEHVEICASARVVVIAPATANTLAKLASGIADTSPTLCALTAMGAGVPVVVAPAMNEALARAPQVVWAISRLREMGVRVVEPVREEGKAKLAPPEEIAEHAIDATAPRDMEGLNVLVTAGPTREHIDAVKFVTTPSSGYTGVAFAREAAARGARVWLVAGPGVKAPNIPGLSVVRVTSVLEMRDAVVGLGERERIDLAVFAAAPLDYYVANRVSGKLSSDLDRVVVELARAPKVVSEFKRVSPRTFVIGFKAEVSVREEELVDRALARLREGGWDLAIAHDVSRLGFGTERDEYLIVAGDGSVRKLGPAHKRELAREVLSLVRPLLSR